MVIQVGVQSSEVLAPRQSDLFMLRRLLCLGRAPVGQGKYDSQEIRNDFNMEEFSCLHRLIQTGRGNEALDIIEKYSCHGLTFQQNAILFALAICCRTNDLRTKRAAFALMRKVCRIPTFLFTFVKYYQNLDRSKGWGRCMKRAISDLYNNYEGGVRKLLRHVTKYQRRKGMSHKDIIRLAHVKPNTRAVALVLKYLTKGYQGVREFCNRSSEHDTELQEAVSFIRASHEARTCQSDRRLGHLIETHALTHEYVPSVKLKDSDIWGKLLPGMPVHALMRNLGRMTASGALTLPRVVQMIHMRLADTNTLRQSLVHPFQLLSTFLNYKSGTSAPEATENLGRLTWLPNSDVLNSLEEAFYRSLQDSNDIRPIEGNILLALDVGLSPKCSVNSSGSLSACTAAWALTLAFVRTQQARQQDGNSCEVVAFSGTSVKPLQISSTDKLTDFEQHWKSQIPYSDQAPDLSKPIREALRRDIRLFVILTSCRDGRLGQSPEEALSCYRDRGDRQNEEASLVVVNMGTERIKNLWNSDDPRILIIEGYDANVFHLIREFATCFN